MQRLGLYLILASLAAPALATIEITPLVGYGIGGSFEEKRTSPEATNNLKLNESGLFGVAVDWDITEETQYEFFFSRQRTQLVENHAGTTLPGSQFDMDVSYGHIGGTVGFGDDRVDPFIVGTVGLTHFDPKNTSYPSKTRFSLSLGGGVKLFITDNLGFRFEGRGLGTLMNGGVWFQSGSGGTQIGIAGDSLWQLQLNAGLILRF